VCLLLCTCTTGGLHGRRASYGSSTSSGETRRRHSALLDGYVVVVSMASYGSQRSGFVVTLNVFIGQEEIEHMTKLLEQKARTFGPEAMKARRGSSSCFCSSADLSRCACVLTWFLSFVSCSFARFTLPYRLRSRWRPSPRPRQAAARLFSPRFLCLSIVYCLCDR
jgi:hypothetical protein